MYMPVVTLLPVCYTDQGKLLEIERLKVYVKLMISEGNVREGPPWVSANIILDMKTGK